MTPQGKAALLFIALLVQPAITARIKRVDSVQKHSNSTSLSAGVDPLTGAIIGTVSVIGSIYSLIKTRRLVAQNEREKLLAAQIVADYMDQAVAGCHVLAVVDSQLHSQDQAMRQLMREDPTGSKFDRACSGAFEIEALQEDLKRRFREVCEDLDGPAFANVRRQCDSLAAVNDVDTMCATPTSSADIRKLLWKLDLSRVRLDGLITGMCDKVPGFVRLVPRFDIETIEAERSGTPLSGSLLQSHLDKERTGVVDVFGLVSLAYSAIGIVDFSADMYDTAVNKNQGFAIFSDFVKREARSQRVTMCNSFSKHFLQAGKVMAWGAALMAARFTDVDLSGRHRFLGDIYAFDWTMNLEKGSNWVCDAKVDCLVPVEMARVGDDNLGYAFPGDQSACHVGGSNGFYRVCAKGGEQPATAVAPEECFSVGFQRSVTKPGSIHKVSFSANAWVLRFAGTFPNSDRPGYDKAVCEKPLKELDAALTTFETVKRQLVSDCGEGELGVMQPSLARDLVNGVPPNP